MSSTAVPLAAVAFAVWAVYLGGLASLQSDCSETQGSRGLTDASVGSCQKQYRYWWFILCWEFVVIVSLAVASVTKKLSGSKTAFVGLFAIGTLLYIEASNTFLTAQNIDYYGSGSPQNRIRTITAGAIMTALINAILVVVLGSDECCEASCTAATASKAEASTATASKAEIEPEAASAAV